MANDNPFTEPAELTKAFENLEAALMAQDNPPKSEVVKAADEFAAIAKNVAQHFGVWGNGYLQEKHLEVTHHARQIHKAKSEQGKSNQIIWCRRGARNFRDQLADIMNGKFSKG